MEKKVIKLISIIIFLIVTILIIIINMKYNGDENIILDKTSLNVIEFDTISKKENKDIIIIDIRNPEELKETGYIKNAINIPYYYSNFVEELEKLDLTKTYLIYCNSGNRTGHTLNIMSNIGFEKIAHLEGGIQSRLSNNKNIVKCNNNDFMC